MRAFARLSDPSGRQYELVHGDVIGRLRSAALPLNDPRVSEAHAMISLREQELRFIALRGGFAVDSQSRTQVTLAPGLRIELARGLFLTVEDLVLPDAVLGIEGAVARQVLPPVASLVLSPSPHLVCGWLEDAAGWLWSDGDGFNGREAGGETRPVAPGETWQLDGHRFAFVPIALALAGLAPTRQVGGLTEPLRIIARFDTVHIHRGDEVLVLAGILARIVAELVAMGEPVEWAALAQTLWPHEPELAVIRSRLDVNLSRLRRRLREARIRSDLVRTDGVGKVELLLQPHDIVEDRG